MPSAYDTLVARLRRISALHNAQRLLQWDQETYMPKGGTEARAASLGALSATTHDMLVAPETSRALAAAEKDEPDERRVALLREVRRDFDRATRVPSELVEAISAASSRALPAWKDARAKSDFDTFAPHLREIVELRRKYAACIDPSREPYEVLFQDYEPYIPLAQARRSLATLREGLRPLVAEAARAPRPKTNVLAGPWPQARQLALNTAVLEAIGYDFVHGRLDVSAHPFTEGNVYDSRITTRFRDDDLLSGLLGTIHEAGHAMYEQGLPREEFGTPLCEARDLVVHESQSRLWENHVGRSRAFWAWAMPLMHEHFPGKLDGASADALWVAANQVAPSPIRIEADELTYHMHIALRFELEEGLVSGDLDVDHLPRAWNERTEAYLGLAPRDDAEGCLQDIHWSLGALGYFPTYSLGSMLAAQLFDAFERSTGPADDRLRRGDFVALLTWLRQHVHRHGRRYTTTDLIHRATGAALSPDALLRNAERKMRAVWDATA